MSSEAIQVYAPSKQGPKQDGVRLKAVMRRDRAAEATLLPLPLATIYRDGIADGMLVRYYPVYGEWWLKECCWLKPAISGLDFAPLKRAGDALAFAIMGISTSDDYYTQYSMEYYGRTIRDLQLVCEKGNRNDMFKILLSVLLAWTYDQINPTERDVIKGSGHTVGLASILQLMGPKAFQHNPEYQAFLFVRFAQLQEAALTRQPSFLASQEWMEVPFELLSKNELHIATDFLGELIPVQQKFKQINEDRIAYPNVKAGLKELFGEIKMFCERLDACSAGIIQRHPSLFPFLKSASRGVMEIPIVRFGHIGDAGMMLSLYVCRLCMYDLAWDVRDMDATIISKKFMSYLENMALDSADGTLSLIPWLTEAAQGVEGIMGTRFCDKPLELAYQTYERLGGYEFRMVECTKQIRRLTAVQMLRERGGRA
ncbi:hypothetical protein NLG97_g5702 [Lecanicillium saksenae]|uniref:Uncharacterized protein n=1 Tax=Lecanicillium saksenae TaxID=468837 RepID=A0ACC1QTL1_9HYPO|nr:hypothetical protein NLG97_g5702 [Lecanicillium saksenae]